MSYFGLVRLCQNSPPVVAAKPIGIPSPPKFIEVDANEVTLFDKSPVDRQSGTKLALVSLGRNCRTKADSQGLSTGISGPMRTK